MTKGGSDGIKSNSGMSWAVLQPESHRPGEELRRLLYQWRVLQELYLSMFLEYADKYAQDTSSPQREEEFTTRAR
ncbi:MAG: hypothetical protein ACFFCW_44580 [Candidatus Hodarchaeota archaeon]